MTAKALWKPGTRSGWIVRFCAAGCIVSTLVAPTLVEPTLVEPALVEPTLVEPAALPAAQHPGRPVG